MMGKICNIWEGGVEKTANEFNKEFLVNSINPDVGRQGDMGIPIVKNNPDHKISKFIST